VFFAKPANYFSIEGQNSLDTTFGKILSPVEIIKDAATPTIASANLSATSF